MRVCSHDISPHGWLRVCVSRRRAGAPRSPVASRTRPAERRGRENHQSKRRAEYFRPHAEERENQEGALWYHSRMSFLDSLFKKKEKSVLGVDIGSSSLKVVQLRKEHGQAVLETYGELALGPYGGSEVGQATNLSAEQIISTLKDLLREAKVTTINCGVSIPFARSLLILVDLPYRADPKEQKTVIELEARKYIPVPVSEVQLDWVIVPEANPSQSETPKGESERGKTVEVLLVAVHNDELSILQKTIAAAGLTASFYEIEIFSTIRATVDEPIKPVMV